ncbi:MAG: hypothetical protein WCF26_27465 [Candidatus Sulfotelmatobacter sp.]
MEYRFEFDAENKILLMRVEGRLTDESLAALYQEALARWAATDASAGISDYSSVTEWAVSAAFIRKLADYDPVETDPTRRPRIIVAPATVGFGLSRMFQIAGGARRPHLTVVRTLDEAFAALGVHSPHFKPLE